MTGLMDDFFFARAYEVERERDQPWWSIVFEGDEWLLSDDGVCHVIGPEYFFALDRGLQP